MAKAATAKEGDTVATVTKRGKQEDLPGVEASQRKIQELEDLGDEVDELEAQLATLKGKCNDANDNLVAAMKRRNRTFYQRQTWGKIVLSDPKTKAKVKKSTGGEGDEGEQD